MAELGKISEYSYYDLMPKIDLEIGDIWHNLPTFGNLGIDHLTGIVITPSCDLSNCKVETITYLPILSINGYFSSRGFAAEYVRIIRNQASCANIPLGSTWDLRGVELPSLPSVEDVILKAEKLVMGQQKISIAAKRIISAAKVIKYIKGVKCDCLNALIVKAMGEKDYNRKLTEIIRNSYSQDIHFLPKVETGVQEGALPAHSVALFRYPLTLPIELLRAANDISVKEWRGATSQLEREFPVARHLSLFRPLKVATMRPRFLNDLVARFVALHVRMGSPDFSNETIDDFVKSIGAKS